MLLLGFTILRTMSLSVIVFTEAPDLVGYYWQKHARYKDAGARKQN